VESVGFVASGVVVTVVVMMFVDIVLAMAIVVEVVLRVLVVVEAVVVGLDDVLVVSASQTVLNFLGLQVHKSFEHLHLINFLAPFIKKPSSQLKWHFLLFVNPSQLHFPFRTSGIV